MAVWNPYDHMYTNDSIMRKYTFRITHVIRTLARDGATMA